MLIIGLTGGIGSGKSTVSSFFSDLGIDIIDADRVAKQLTVKDSPFYHKIIKHFGDDCILHTKELDRKKLRHFIFSDPQEREWLEHMLHPPIRLEIQRQLANIRSPYGIVIIPLLAQKSNYTFLDRVCTIDTEIKNQLKRTSERDQVDPNMATAMIQSQISRKQRLAIADDVIINNGSVSELKERVYALNDFYLELSINC